MTVDEKRELFKKLDRLCEDAEKTKVAMQELRAGSEAQRNQIEALKSDSEELRSATQRPD